MNMNWTRGDSSSKKIFTRCSTVHEVPSIIFYCQYWAYPCIYHFLVIVSLSLHLFIGARLLLCYRLQLWLCCSTFLIPRLVSYRLGLWCPGVRLTGPLIPSCCQECPRLLTDTWRLARRPSLTFSHSHLVSLVSLIGHSHHLTDTSHLTQPGFWGSDRVTEEATKWQPLCTLMAPPLCTDSTSCMVRWDLMYQLWVHGFSVKNSFTMRLLPRV